MKTLVESILDMDDMDIDSIWLDHLCRCVKQSDINSCGTAINDMLKYLDNNTSKYNEREVKKLKRTFFIRSLISKFKGRSVVVYFEPEYGRGLNILRFDDNGNFVQIASLNASILNGIGFAYDEGSPKNMKYIKGAIFDDPTAIYYDCDEFCDNFIKIVKSLPHY